MSNNSRPARPEIEQSDAQIESDLLTPPDDYDDLTGDTHSRMQDHRHEDPLTGELGAHPIGAGIGAILGGATGGAAVGSLAGPVGAIVGTIVGGVAGGLAGKAIAEEIDPTVEAAYWRDTFHQRPYYSTGLTYEDYESAYRAGWESYDPSDRAEWHERERLAKERWESEGGAPTMTWEQAKQAARDAYLRVRDRNPIQRSDEENR